MPRLLLCFRLMSNIGEVHSNSTIGSDGDVLLKDGSPTNAFFVVFDDISGRIMLAEYLSDNEDGSVRVVLEGRVVDLKYEVLNKVINQIRNIYK